MISSIKFAFDWKSSRLLSSPSAVRCHGGGDDVCHRHVSQIHAQARQTGEVSPPLLFNMLLRSARHGH